MYIQKMLGSVSFLASMRFVRYIYSNSKMDWWNSWDIFTVILKWIDIILYIPVSLLNISQANYSYTNLSKNYVFKRFNELNNVKTNL